MEITRGGRPAYVVNVEVYLHRGDRWLMIKRSDQEAHAPGTLSAPGGKAEPDGPDPVVGILEQTAVREALEEVGVDLAGADLSYVESCYFAADDGDPVINIVFAGALPPGAEPHAASADEVAAVRLMTVPEILAEPDCPPWTRRALTKADSLRKDGSSPVR
jgi:8-oxo-dGTP pyrophosphatase MutT (NUDIX family)